MKIVLRTYNPSNPFQKEELKCKTTAKERDNNYWICFWVNKKKKKKEIDAHEHNYDPIVIPALL